MKFNRIFYDNTWSINKKEKVENPIHHYLSMNQNIYSLDLALLKNKIYFVMFKGEKNRCICYNFKLNSPQYNNTASIANLYYYNLLNRASVVTKKYVNITFFLQEFRYLNLEVSSIVNNDEIFDDKLNVMINDFIKPNIT